MKKYLNKATIMGIVRHALTTVGGLLIAKGILTEDLIADGIGALLTLTGVVWSAFEKGKVDAQKIIDNNVE